jgi:hypothetical protein
MSKKILEKIQKQEWQKLSNYWNLIAECARPSRKDIEILGAIIHRKIKNIKNPVIVIFGSTPELRDLCFSYSLRYNARIICIELVKDMYLAMTKLMMANNNKEEVVFCDWLKINLPDSLADVVIGDLTEGNITDDNLRPKYLSEVSRILKKNGKYITRHTAYISKNKAEPLLNVSQINKQLTSYCNQILNGQLTLRQAGNFLGARLLWDSYYKTKKDKICFSVYNKEMRILSEEHRNDKLKTEILNIANLVWGPIKDKYWVYYDIDKTLNNFKKYFKNIKYYYADDYPVAYLTPTFEMIVKK